MRNLLMNSIINRCGPVFACVFVYGQALSQATLFRIPDFGAVGDGTTMNTSAIQRAIDECARKGGGTVLVPPGIFLSGTLQLRTNVNLHLESGGTLKGSGNVQDYKLNGRVVGMLFTQDARNVSITGQGTIDGNGDLYVDLSKAKRIDSAGSAQTRQRIRFREVAGGLGDGPLVPKERPFQMIIFSDCRKVTVRDVLITESPFWTLHFADCDGVILSGVRIWCNLMVPNNDGVDFTSCSNVLMSDCDIRTGDDAVVITGYSHHWDLPGFKELRHVSENITIANCTLVSRSSGIRIGGFDQNSMRNCVFNNITITNSNRGIGLFARDEGSIENMIFSNIVIDTRLHTGDWWGNGEPIHLSAVRLTKDVKLGQIRNIKFQNVIARSEAGIVVYGTDESVIKEVSFENVALHIAESRLNESGGGNFDLRPVLDPKLQLFSHDIPGFFAQHVKGLRLRDVDLTWGAVNQPFFTHGIEVTNFEGVTIDNFHGSAAPCSPQAHPIYLHDGNQCEVRGDVVSVSKEHVN
jgi:polygalacturonase